MAAEDELGKLHQSRPADFQSGTHADYQHFSALLSSLANLRKSGMSDCFTAVLEFVAGMLCFSCREDWKDFGTLTPAANHTRRQTTTSANAAGVITSSKGTLLVNALTSRSAGSMRGNASMWNVGPSTSYAHLAKGNSSANRAKLTADSSETVSNDSLNLSHAHIPVNSSAAPAKIPAQRSATVTNDSANSSIANASSSGSRRLAPGSEERRRMSMISSSFSVRISSFEEDAVWARCNALGDRSNDMLQSWEDGQHWVDIALSAIERHALTQRLEVFLTKDTLMRALYQSVVEHPIAGVVGSQALSGGTFMMTSVDPVVASGADDRKAYAPMGEGRSSGFDLHWPSGEDALRWAHAPPPWQAINEKEELALGQGVAAFRGIESSELHPGLDMKRRNHWKLVPMLLVLSLPLLPAAYAILNAARHGGAARQPGLDTARPMIAENPMSDSE